VYDSDSGFVPTDEGETTEKVKITDDYQSSDEDDHEDDGVELYIKVDSDVYEFRHKMKIKIDGLKFPEMNNSIVSMYNGKFWLVDLSSKSSSSTEITSSIRTWIDTYLYESSALKEKADRRYDLVCKI